MGDVRKLILHAHLSPGDVLTLTAAVESLHSTYPGEFETDIRTSVPAVWEHNPWITKIEDDDGQHIECEYPLIHVSGQVGYPFIAGYTHDLGVKIGRPLSLTTNRPHVYLSEDEKAWMSQVQQHATHGKRVPYWLVNAGVKRDYTAKQWPVESYQEVVFATRDVVQWVQIGSGEHDHLPLQGVIDLCGQTDHRQLLRLAYHATGGLGSVTYLQHICAALEKPYVCVLGGRESATWVSYPRQSTLHTIGQLPCCRSGGCWKSRVIPLADGDKHDASVCELPVLGGVRPVAKCMAMISVAEVAAIVRRIAAARSMW